MDKRSQSHPCISPTYLQSIGLSLAHILLSPVTAPKSSAFPRYPAFIFYSLRRRCRQVSVGSALCGLPLFLFPSTCLSHLSDISLLPTCKSQLCIYIFASPSWLLSL